MTRAFAITILIVSFMVVCAPAFSDLKIAANSRYFEDDGRREI